MITGIRNSTAVLRARQEREAAGEEAASGGPPGDPSAEVSQPRAGESAVWPPACKQQRLHWCSPRRPLSPAVKVSAPRSRGQSKPGKSAAVLGPAARPPQ